MRRVKLPALHRVRFWAAVAVAMLVLTSVSTTLVVRRLVAPQRVTAQGTQLPLLGGMDLDGYCRSQGHLGVTLVGQTINDWHCLTNIDVNGVCQQQYGPNTVARYTDFNDPNSWGCYAQSGGPPANATAIDWGSRQAQEHRGSNGQRYAYFCPPNGSLSGAVWGTDVYTDDSAICTAAVHAGLITVAGGGTVTLEIRPGESGYRGSTRNGVTTADYGAWSGSYVFVR